MRARSGGNPRVDGPQRSRDGQQRTGHDFSGVVSSSVHAGDALKAARSAAKRETWVGIAIFVIGIIAWGTSSVTKPGDGYLVAWVSILFGGYQIAKGLYHLDELSRPSR